MLTLSIARSGTDSRETPTASISWECDLIDVQALSRHNDGVKYLLTVINVFSKFLHMVPLKSKSGKDVSSAFQLVLKDPRYSKPFKRRPVWVRTDKGKAFLNESFQKLLKREGIHFQVCRNPDIKCSIVERVQQTVRDKLYKYFTHKNTYRYVDVLSDFVSGCNTTIHGSTGMAPANVKLALWKRMQKRRGKVRVKMARYSVGQHVRISKEKAKFAKSAEQNFSTKIFRIIKVIHRTPRPVYELEDLNRKVIDGQFYEEEHPYASRYRRRFRSKKSSPRGRDEALSNT